MMYLALWLLAAIPSTISAPTATTVNGTYNGLHIPALTQDIFLGIPFAHQSRFEPATSLNETWNGTRDAVEPGLTCAGFGTNPRENWPVGEDCLNLNVVRPEGAYPGLDLPVLVWIYGGGWRQGSNRDPEFNTSFMVQTSMETGHPVIVVSINYRLSVFGFLGSKQVAGNGALNLGLKDQRKALQWVQENIRGFGGDPNRVTMWGESAGALSTALQIMAYGGDTHGLFRAGIMASGSFFGFGQGNLESAQQIYDNVTNTTGCYYADDSLQCLKDLPFETINATAFEQSEGTVFLPIVDGDFFQTYADVAFKRGRIPPVNIITGCNSEEGILLDGQTNANTSAELAAYMEAILAINSTIAEKFLDLYPIDAPSPPYQLPLDYPWVEATAEVGVYSGNQTRRAYGIFTDLAVMAGRRKTAAAWSSFGAQAYSFRWDTYPTTFPLVYTAGLGPGFAQHGAELSWEFRLPYIAPTPYPPLPNVTAMHCESYAMQAAWASFAATGSPNHHGLDWVPYWPSYDNGTMNFVFNATLGNTLNLHLEKDDFRQAGIDYINQKWGLLNA